MSTDTDQSTEAAITGGAADGARRIDSLAKWVLFGCAFVTVATTLAIFWVLLSNAFSFFTDVTLWQFLTGADATQRVSVVEFLTSTHWDPNHPSNPGFGIWPLLSATLLITVLGAFVSIPIGTATAIYLSEYAQPRTRKYLKPVLEILAGIPTIVYGFFAISFITPVLLNGILFRPVGVEAGRLNALSGAIAVGIMTIPIVASISEDAITAVPEDLKNGAYAMGASKYQVAISVIIPSSLSGILASYILAVSRAIGETMAVTLAAGATANFTANPLDEVQTMTAYMVQRVRGTSAVGTVEYQSLFAVGLALFVITFAANMLNDYVKRQFREEYR